jgi:hypothetical protein
VKYCPINNETNQQQDCALNDFLCQSIYQSGDEMEVVGMLTAPYIPVKQEGVSNTCYNNSPPSFSLDWSHFLCLFLHFVLFSLFV